MYTGIYENGNFHRAFKYGTRNKAFLSVLDYKCWLLVFHDAAWIQPITSKYDAKNVHNVLKAEFSLN